MTAACSDRHAAQASSPPQTTIGCIDRFDEAIDYFPDKAVVEDAGNVSVEYHRSYKIVTVHRTYLGGPSERYILLRCGAPKPHVSADLAKAAVVPVPIASLFSSSTTHVPLLVDLERLAAAHVVELGRYPHSGWFGRLSQRDHEVVRRAIAAVGAQHLAACDYSKLSDGERQRILIARALAQEPLMLLLDEPTAFLDVPSRVELMGLLRRLSHDEHLAVVASTHDLELALRTADMLWLIMPDGRLHAGAPEDIVADGRIDEVFKGETIRFSAEEQTCRLVTGDRGEAVVRGGGLQAALARAVLEREGFAVVSYGDAVLTVVAEGDSGWRASFGDRVGRGERFAALASFVRGLPEAGDAQ